MSIDKQLKKLRDYFAKHKSLPTYEEMAELFGYKSKSTAYYSVNKLVEEGYLKRDDKGNLIPGQNFLGLPYFKSALDEDRVSLEAFLVRKPNSTILVEVKDDSMVGDGILKGDAVIVERYTKAGLGETIAVHLEDDFVVRKIAKKGQRYVLASANSDYPDLPLDQHAQSALIGIVKGVARRYE